ncbi:MAG: hypothetical protein MK074_03575 [Phycisphaerales bacterium]|nr:hypothetical protein [Phycisphaerales bacterium]
MAESHAQHDDLTLASLDPQMLADWIDDPQRPCPQEIIDAMAVDPTLRSMIRDLRLDRFQVEAAPAHVIDRAAALQRPTPVLATIGRWTAAAAAAIAIAVVGFQLGTASAGVQATPTQDEFAAFGLTPIDPSESLIAMLLPSEGAPS